VLIVHFPSPRQPFRPGGGRAALWQTRERNTTVTRVLAPIQGSPAPPRAARPTNHHCSLGVACRGIRPFGALWRALCDRGAGNPAPRNPRAAVAPVPRGRGLRTPGDRLPLVPFQAEFGGGRPVRQAPRRPRPDAQAADSAALTWSARMPGSSVTGLRPKPQYAASPNSGRYLRANATRCRNRSILWIAPR